MWLLSILETKFSVEEPGMMMTSLCVRVRARRKKNFPFWITRHMQSKMELKGKREIMK